MRKGFTLIELLIVLAVIAALMAIVTPIALNAVAQARATQVASNLRNIKSAIESYVSIERDLPSSTSTLWSNLVSKGYLSSSPGSYQIINIDNTSSWQTSGLATVTILFTGSVDANKVNAIYPEATQTTNGVKVDFKISRWW